MDCFSVLIVASFVFGLMTYGVVLMVQHDYRKERDQIQIECDQLSSLLDKANRSMSEVAAERRAVAKSLGDLIVEHTAVRDERDEAIAELEKVTKERDELKLAADEIRNDFIKDGMWNTVKKVELREKLEIIKAEIDNLITIDLEEK